MTEVGRDILPRRSKKMGSSSKKWGKSLTRREFLEDAGHWALAIAASGLTGAGVKKIRESNKPGENEEKPAEKPFQTARPPESTAPPPPKMEVKAIPPKETPQKEVPQPKNYAFELVFGQLNRDEKDDARRRVDEQIKHYQKDPGLQNRIANSQKWQKEIEEVAKELGFKPDSFVPPLLAALIFVESGGNPKADSGIAKGLCQLRWSTAKASAERLGTTIMSENNLFDPKLNITLALESLHHFYQRFPDRGLVLWSYHLGETNLALAIGAYAIAYGNKKEEIYEILNDSKQIGTANLTRNPKYGEPNFIKLINSQGVTSQLKEDRAFGDDTEFYVPRIVAAAELLTQTE